MLSGLLTRDPTQRLGSGEADAEEVKGHPFFADTIDWGLLLRGGWVGACRHAMGQGGDNGWIGA